ncbi:hypothetical protein [Brevundimonas denitrificans]
MAPAAPEPRPEPAAKPDVAAIIEADDAQISAPPAQTQARVVAR